MLAHPPSFQFVIDYRLDKDEEGAILALNFSSNMIASVAPAVRLLMPVTILQKLIVAMDDEYLILEYLIIGRKGAPVLY